MAETASRRRLAAILAADVVGYSRLMGADEEGTLAAVKDHRAAVIDPALAAHHGRLFKTMGDGLLAEFGSVVDAVRCALAIQAGVAARNAGVAEDRQVRFRIGVNLGDVIAEGDDVFGDGVNVAARLEGLAEPGTVCISGAVYDSVRNRVDGRFVDLGPQKVKNIAEPVRAYRLQPEQREPAPPPTAQQPERRSVAVLPFTNMSRDPEQEYFSDGISEDIITDLSKIAGLFVIARNSSFVYKGRAVSVTEVGRELGVRYVLEGSVRKAGERVRVTAQLIDAHSGGHLWAERYDRDLADIFAVQDELTREIVAALEVKLTADEQRGLARRPTANVEAYDLFLRGREQAWLHTKAGNETARPLLQRALELDAGFAAALAFLGFTYVTDYINAWTDPPEAALSTALDLARRAVALDEAEPTAHWVLGVASMWSRDFDTARTEVERCAALEPSFGDGIVLRGHLASFTGGSVEAIEAFETYMHHDPHFPDLILHFLAQAQFNLERFEEAAETLRRRLARNSESETSQVLLASALGHLGRIEEARAAWAEAKRINPSYSIEHRRHVLPYKDPADFERFAAGLAKAGVG